MNNVEIRVVRKEILDWGGSRNGGSLMGTLMEGPTPNFVHHYQKLDTIVTLSPKN